MADRKVTHTGKDSDGDITKLCNQAVWGNATKAAAIQHIESGTHSYYVQQPGTARADIHVVNGPTGKYLRSDPDPNSNNNLDNLPDC